MMPKQDIHSILKEEAAAVERYLESCLNLLPALPEGLKAAMNYSLLAGGKRLRPLLCLRFALSFLPEGKSEREVRQAVMPFAAGIECIHTYSLIHDDLPAMDNDDMRRGRPSNHKKFDEATAILAGDALLTDAFTFMASTGKDIAAERVLNAITCMATAAGSPGMVGGQYYDMQYTNRDGIELTELRQMHAMKTGALLTASCLCGAILGGADAAGQQAASAYGSALGSAFQIMDDVLDETGDSALLGKPVGSDAVNGKTTYPSLLGLEKSKELAREEAGKAVAALPESNQQRSFFQALAQYIVERDR